MQSNKAWDTKGCGYTLINHPFPSLSPPLSLSLSLAALRLVILYYIKLIICAARLYILFYQLALDRPAIRSVFSNARYQRGKIGLRPDKKVASFTACLRRAPLDLTKTHSARMWNVPKLYRNEKFRYILPPSLTWQWGLKRCLLHGIIIEYLTVYYQ